MPGPAQWRAGPFPERRKDMERAEVKVFEVVRRDGCGFEYEALQGEDGIISIYLDDRMIEYFPSREAAEEKYRF